MYEESKRTSWLGFLIKAIIAVIFILFVVWLLSLSTKGLSNSISEYGKKLDVLTDTITTDNFSRLEQVGKDYFTTARLPKNVGDVEKVTLKELYEKNLILEVKDKNGNACSAENSYISVTKLESEYQMKIYLECGKAKDFVLVNMGCYDTCIDCDKKEEKIVKKVTQYQYKKATNGKWSDYGAWSEWTKNKITSTDERQVETKNVTEKYYEPKTETRTISEKATCPSGYDLVGTTCVKTNQVNPTCPTGYSQSGLTCTKTTETTPTCPTGYDLVGTTCKKTVKTNPSCAVKDGWSVSRSGFTCTYTRQVETQETFVEQRTGSYLPSDTSVYHYEYVTSRTQWNGCEDECSLVTMIVYNVYRKATTKTETSSGRATCPSGYSESGTQCVTTTTKTPTCSQGTLTNGKCVSTSTVQASCQVGTLVSGKCNVSSTTKPVCKDSTYTLSGATCSKTETVTINVEKTRTVVYYRSRTRKYTGGTTTYKWSNSKNDKSLLNAGYKLTGKTRVVNA